MFELREYQLDAVERIRLAIRSGKKSILLVAPCGSGKTVIGAHIISKAVTKHSHSLFIAHRRELIKQCSNKLKNFGVDHALMLAGEPMSAMEPVQVASIQTFNIRMVKNKKIPTPIAHIVMIDEGHHSTADSYLRLKEIYPEAIFLGLTATPCRSDGRGLGKFYDELIEVATPLELIEMGFLVPTRVVAPIMPDLKGVKVRQGDYEVDELSKRMFPLVGNLIRDWRQYGQNRPTVVFAVDIAHSVYIQERFEAAGFRCGHIDGDTPINKRDETLQALDEGYLQIVTNCNVLTEGFDQPKISCCILARPTKSYGLYLQMAGRICRPDTGKTDALIIDHAGGVYKHGFPQDAGGWSLDPEFSINERVKEQLAKEPAVITCAECFTVYTGQAHCPNCLAIPTKRGQSIMMQEGRLFEVKRTKLPAEQYSMEQKADYMGQLKALELHYKNKPGWAANIYREKFAVWPNHPDIRNAPMKTPTIEVKNFVRSRQIAYAKRRA
jgi:DNA repair protein RadD